MTFSSCLMYAKKIFFSKPQKSDSGIGKRSLSGAVACIGISLVPMVVLLVVTNGMVHGMTRRMIKLFSQDISISVYKNSMYLASYENYISASKKIAGVQGVEKVFPEVRGIALAAGQNYRSGAFVRGVPRDAFFSDENFSSLFKIIEGGTEFPNLRTAVIGEKISEQLGVHVGDNIKIITMNKTKGKFIPRVSQFKVGGIISSGYQELDALWVFIPIEAAFNFLAKSSCEFVIGVETENSFSDSLSSVAERLQTFSFQDEGFSDSRVETWKEVNEAELENFASTKALLVVIMIMIVVVASISVSSSVLIIVMERKKEIALLKCVGASPAGIAFSFVLTGASIGLAGILIGIPVGLLISVNINEIIAAIESCVNFFERFSIGGSHEFAGFHLLDPAYYLQDIPVEIPVKEIVAVALCTLFLSALVSLIPSVKAGKEKPIDTLRKM